MSHDAHIIHICALETALDAGLSGPSRLHDLFINFKAITPGEFKKQGQGLKITYSFNASPFGECLLATTKRGICYLCFVELHDRSKTLAQLFDTLPGSEFVEEPTAICSLVKRIFRTDKQKPSQSFNLLLKGTNFQVNEWIALLDIPKGCVVSYQDIASYIGHPKAFRTVASAIAVNPVAFLIPCHRVIAKSGKTHRYRWGSSRKKAIFGWKAAQRL